MELVTRPSETVSALAVAAPCPNTLGAFKKNLNKHMVAVAIIQKRDIVIIFRSICQVDRRHLGGVCRSFVGLLHDSPGQFGHQRTRLNQEANEKRRYSKSHHTESPGF
jgi:hypothetical protein